MPVTALLGTLLQWPLFQHSTICINGPTDNPGAPLTNFNDGDGGGGGVRKRFIFYTQKNHNFRICLPKKSLLCLAYPKNPLVLFRNPKKSLCFFFPYPKKSRRLSYTPKNNFWPKFQTQKNHSDPLPPVFKICEWGPWDWQT